MFGSRYFGLVVCLVTCLGTTCVTRAMRVQPTNAGMYALRGHDSYRVASLPGYGDVKQDIFSGCVCIYAVRLQ